MKDYSTILVLLIFFTGVDYQTLAQEEYKPAEETLSSHIISGSVNRGFLLPHHDLMNYYLQKKTTSFTLGLEKELKGGWTSDYGFISKGIEVSRSSLSNDEILGSSTHLAGFAHCGIHSNGKGKLKFGAGVGVLSQKFDIDKNVKNIAIGSTLNWAVILEYSYSFTLHKSISISPHLRFVHYSNGAYRLPNLGLNLVSCGLSIERIISNLAIDSDVKQKHTPEQRISIGISYGKHELISHESGQFANSNLSLQYISRKPKKMFWGAGLDVHYSGAYENYYNLNSTDAQSKSSFSQSLRTGAHGAFGLKLGISEIHMNLGVYFIDKLDLNGPVYQRIYFQSRITDNLNYRIGLKAHKAAAETFEIGLITNLWSK